ncbi:MAG: chromosome segregation SMC family protein [Candidatus Anstonellales archaeon]
MRIKEVRMRGFKSFNKARIELPSNVVCISGPNGSGKSNICDAIRFAMGESRLSKLRAKKVKDLINLSGKTAEVELIIDNGKEVRIKRAIREDGKVLYKMDGKRVKRHSVQEFFRRLGIDGSWRNVIAQGEVDWLLKVSGRERRQVVDAAAGIVEFEEKKEEALKNLEVVDGRIKEASLILGEKQSYLDELKKEKERAETWMAEEKRFKSARMGLIKAEKADVEKKLVEINKKMRELDILAGAAREEMAKIEEAEKQIDAQRKEMLARLEKSQNKENITKIERLKAEVESLEKRKQDYLEQAELLKNKIIKGHNELKELEEKARTLEAELKELGAHATEKAEELKIEKEEGIDEIVSAIEELRNKKEMLLAGKAELLPRLGAMKAEKERAEAQKKEVEEAKKRIQEIERESKELFKKEKELNEEIKEIDRRILELREKMAVRSAVVRPPVLDVIEGLKKEIDGIYGPVGNLISCAPEYESAVGSAAGSRLAYVVVEDLDTAEKVIKRIKNIGRATFIPLKEIKEERKVEGSIADVIEFDQQVAKAINYIFGGTKLVRDFGEAKKNLYTRCVTLEGELFEASGVVSGGKEKRNALDMFKSAKTEEEIEAESERRKAVMDSLNELRKEMSELRGEKAALDIKVREAVGTPVEGVEVLEAKVAGIDAEIAAIDGELSNLEAKLEKAMAEREEKAKEMERKLREREESIQRAASIRGDIKAKEKEMEIANSRALEVRKEIEENEKMKKSLEKKIREADEEMLARGEEVIKLEAIMEESSKEEKRLYAELRKLEEKYSEIGRQKVEIAKRAEKAEREKNKMMVEEASLSTKLQDLMKNYDENVEAMEGEWEELERIVKQAEETMNSLGQVNFAAPELYEKKKAEADDVKRRIEVLSKEREKVMEMMASLEERKKEAFFKTFEKVAENFSSMLKQMLGTEGYVYLDKPSSPFESAMHFKITKNVNGIKKEMNIEMLSGGEKSLVALVFIFALQFVKPSPFYILDEADAALDKENAPKLAQFLKKQSETAQFIVVSHNENVIKEADVVYGVARGEKESRIFGIKIKD